MPSQQANEKQNISAKTGFALSEVAKHNNVSDCWLIIDSKVYDVSSYINFHPGNPETIIPYCGKDATKAFKTKDKIIPKTHSQKAWNLLSDYYIGDLNQ